MTESYHETIYREPYHDDHHRHHGYDERETELNYKPTMFDDHHHASVYGHPRYIGNARPAYESAVVEEHVGPAAYGMHGAHAMHRGPSALPIDAETHKYQTYTYKLKSHGTTFDTTMPYALRDRMTKTHFLRHVEKVNDMMAQRPSELTGYARECERKKKKWATIAILADIALVISFIVFVIAFAAFWTFLGIAVDTLEDWWWPTVIAAAIWVLACFFMTVLTTIAILGHHKWRKWSKISYDEENMLKYHGIIAFLRRENERDFADKGLSWELSLNNPERHSAGWTRSHHPTLDVLVYHKTPIPRVNAQQLHARAVPAQRVSEAPTMHAARVVRTERASAVPAAPKQTATLKAAPSSAGTTSSQKDVVVMKPTMERTAIAQGQKDEEEK